MNKGGLTRGPAFRLKYQIWVQSDFNFSTSSHQLAQMREVSGDVSITHPGIYYFKFVDSPDVKYEITTKSKLSISFPEELGFDSSKELIEKVKPFLRKTDGTLAKKFVIIHKTYGGRPIDEAKQINLLKIENANPGEVLEHLKALKETINLDIIGFRLGQLVKIARSQRLANIDELLTFCEKALKESKYQTKRILRKLIDLVWLMLSIERYYKFPNSPQTVGRIQGEILESILEIAKSCPDSEVLIGTIYFLKLTYKKESVATIFRLVETMNTELYGNLEGFIIEALFREGSVLNKYQSKLINEKIDELLESDNLIIQARAKELSIRAS